MLQRLFLRQLLRRRSFSRQRHRNAATAGFFAFSFVKGPSKAQIRCLWRGLAPVPLANNHLAVGESGHKERMKSKAGGVGEVARQTSNLKALSAVRSFGYGVNASEEQDAYRHAAARYSQEFPVNLT